MWGFTSWGRPWITCLPYLVLWRFAMTHWWQGVKADSDGSHQVYQPGFGIFGLLLEPHFPCALGLTAESLQERQVSDTLWNKEV